MQVLHGRVCVCGGGGGGGAEGKKERGKQRGRDMWDVTQSAKLAALCKHRSISHLIRGKAYTIANHMNKLMMHACLADYDTQPPLKGRLPCIHRS